MNRLVDYEEDAIVRGAERGFAERKKRLENQEREPMAPVADLNLSLWGRKLREHLKAFRPRQYADLKASGQLNDYCQKIADQASLEMSDLLDTGLPYNQAFELIRDQLYPPPESPRRKP